MEQKNCLVVQCAHLEKWWSSSMASGWKIIQPCLKPPTRYPLVNVHITNWKITMLFMENPLFHETCLKPPSRKALKFKKPCFKPSRPIRPNFFWEVSARRPSWKMTDYTNKNIYGIYQYISLYIGYTIDIVGYTKDYATKKVNVFFSTKPLDK